MTPDSKLAPAEWSISMLCPQHGRDYALSPLQRAKIRFDHVGERASWWRQVEGCKACQGARRAAQIWEGLEKACGIQVGPAPFDAPAQELARRGKNRFNILGLLATAHAIDEGTWIETDAIANPHRSGPGPRVKPRADVIIRSLAVIFDGAGGKPEAMIKDDRYAVPHQPFAKFLFALWPHLPASCRLQTPVQFTRRARQVLAYRRNRDGLSKTTAAHNLRVKVTAGVAIGRRNPGEIFEVPSRDGIVWDPYWRKRLAEGAVAVIGVVQ